MICYSCSGVVVPSLKTAAVIAHRAFHSLRVPLTGLMECSKCAEVYVPSGYDDAISQAYATKLRERIRLMVITLGVEDFDLEVLLGLDAGEVSSLLSSPNCGDDETKTMAAVHAVLLVLTHFSKVQDIPTAIEEINLKLEREDGAG